MTPERYDEILHDLEASQQEWQRLADERNDCGPDASVIRWNEPDKEPWVA